MERNRFPVGELWEDDVVIHEVIDRAEYVSVLYDVLYYKRDREDSITGIATRTNDLYRWLFIQRQRRFLYLRERHPDLMIIENQNMARVAVRYAATLTESSNTEGINKVSS